MTKNDNYFKFHGRFILFLRFGMHSSLIYIFPFHEIRSLSIIHFPLEQVIYLID